MKHFLVFVQLLPKGRLFLISVCLLLIFSSSLTAAVYPNPYDIVYHRISLFVDPGTSGAISNGSVTTYFKTTKATVNQIGFDLNQSMNISSVTYHGSAISAGNYPHVSNAVIITLPSSIPVSGTLDSITINYNGTPIPPGSPVPSGYNYSGSSKAIYTLGESFTGNTWWPCHDSLTDKIDSVDLVITTPLAYRAAGNGNVTEYTNVTNRVSSWKTRYRIATYMVNFAAANYVDYFYTVLTNGKTLQVHNYLYSADNTATYKTGVDFIKTILPVFVNKFNDDYPFVNEKYGIADCFGSWGALEVQSMTFCATSSITSNSTLAHELAHQWFADKLTTNDWHQIWLNEGFAQYCESVIYPENLLSAATAQSRRTSLKSSVNNTSATYVNNISSAQTIFAGTDQPYEKGAMTLSMLRSWLGDANFFNALHNYLQAPGIAYDFTSVDSLKFYMQQQTPNDLTTFFSDWVNKKGKVTYAVKYQYVTNGVYLQLIQSPTNAGQGHFDTPVPIQIQNGSGLDTTIVVIDRGGNLYNSVTGTGYSSNTIYFPLSATPNIAPIVDPLDVVLADASSTASSSTLSSLIVLPIQDLSLTVSESQGSAIIKWKMTSDEPVNSVTIQKSTDGKTFDDLSVSIPSVVSSVNYQGQYTDKGPGSSIVYYRVKAMAKSGNVIYSAAKQIRFNSRTQISVSPNPVQSQFKVTIPSTISGAANSAKLVVYNQTGQIIFQRILGTENELIVDSNGWSKGIYTAVIISGGIHHSEIKIIKD